MADAGREGESGTCRPAQDAVVEAVRQWQNRLLQLDRRNALLYFPIGKRGVTLIGTEPDALLERLRGARAGLPFPYAERIRPTIGSLFRLPESADEGGGEPRVRVVRGDLECDLPPLELQRRLNALRQRNREWKEEQGLSVLYIALGFLHWIDEDQQAACSPIILVPCELKRKSPRDPHYLVCDETDEQDVNVTLHYQLSSAAGVTLPERGENSIAEYLHAVAAAVQGKEKWSVDAGIVISTFPYSKLAMWSDLNVMAKGGVKHPLVRRLGGDTNAPVVVPETGGSALPRDDEDLQGGRLDDLIDIHDQHAVVDADFSQLRAIELARSGVDLVIHGPPGTGKSQTIANVIATLLAEGRRVLFVSEKTAALDVVKKRLADAGLAGFCLDLHSDRGKKASVYDQLREALRQEPARPREFPYERLLSRRKMLNGGVRALHEVRHPIGLSAFDVHGRIAALSDKPRIRLDVPRVTALDGDHLLRIEDAARRVALRGREYQQHSTCRWRALGAVDPTPRLSDLLQDDLETIRSAARGLAAAARHTASTYGLEEPANLESVDRLARLVRHLACARAPVPLPWLEDNGLNHARECADSLQADDRERRQALARAGEWLAEPHPCNRSGECLEVLCKVGAEARRWDALVGPSWGAIVLADPAGSAAKWREYAMALECLGESSKRLQSILCVPVPGDSRQTVDRVVGLAAGLLGVGGIPETWDGAASVAAVRSLVEDARSLWANLVAAEEGLEKQYDLGVIEHVDDEMLARYRTDYRPVWRVLRSSFRRDQRTIRGFLRVPGRLGVDAATRAVEGALQALRLRSAWRQMEDALRPVLGDRLRGRDTDWGRVGRDLDELARVFEAHPSQVDAICCVLSDTSRLGQLAAAAGEACKHMQRLEQIAAPVHGDKSRESMQRLADDARAFGDACERVGEILTRLGPWVTRPCDVADLTALLRICDGLHRLEERAAGAEPRRAGAIGPQYNGWKTDFPALMSALAWAEEALRLLGRAAPVALLDHFQHPRPPEVYLLEDRHLCDAIDRYLQAARGMGGRFAEGRTPWGEWRSAALSDVVGWADDLLGHVDEAADWLEYRAAARDLDAAVGGPATDAVRAATDEASVVPDVVLRHVYLSWLENLYHAVPELRASTKDVEAVRHDFTELDAALPSAARERVRARCLAAYPATGLPSHGIGELGTLHHQLSLKRRQLPVRQLVSRIPNVLQRLKPCFMMSPLAVSQYLPRGTTEAETLEFDTVVFDEASQVFPEDAVPAVARGRQTIVVGDQQQLPPTSFFRRDGDGDQDEEDDGEEENRLAGVESILDVMVGMRAAGVEDVYLKVHYRSRHDALIRYSNHYFYDDRLVTFPSALGPRMGLGLRDVYVAEGRYDAGGSRTNQIEAERVVDIVFDMMEACPPAESIGVVALSRSQADLIEQLIEMRRLGDRQHDWRFAEDAHERLFVKNLENVQGDERDHVVLSIGYGRTPGAEVVPNRFGPVNAPGGHRRLNVAVSRARRSMTVVHSLLPKDIRSETQGARLLRRYLEYASLGEVALEGPSRMAAGGEAESPFEDAVGRALEAGGYRIKRQVGCARYWIDIAVMSESGEDYDLAVECDGATYHRSASARDRDRLRQEVLERMGWHGRVHRVWSTAWIQSPQRELERIERAIREARSRPRDPRPRPPQAGGADAVRSSPSGPKPPMEGQSGVVRPVTQGALATYVEASLGSRPVRRDLREERSLGLASLVETVVRAEGPVHVDVVVERLRRHYGVRRAGRRVRLAVMSGIEHALRSGSVRWLPELGGSGKRSAFLVPASVEQFAPRGPSGTGQLRRIDHICEQELDAAAVHVVRLLGGAGRADAILAAARALGYSRTGKSIEGRIGAALDRLMAEGRLAERMGSLVAIE